MTTTPDFSYPGALSSTDKVSLVRLTIGDTDADDAIFSDSEIEIVLSLQTDVTLASATMADFAAAKFARDVNKGIGSTNVSAAQKAESYRQLAKTLRSYGPGTLPGGDGTGLGWDGGMRVGGMLKDERTTQRADTSLVQPGFRIGADAIPGGPEFAHDSDDFEDC